MIELNTAFEYSNLARLRLKRVLSDNVEVLDRPFATLSRFNTVRGLLSHIIGAEDRWINRRMGGRETIDFETRVPADVDQIFVEWDLLRTQTLDKVQSYLVDKQEHIYKLKLHDVDIEIKTSEVLFHLINHETHHRAQISLALMQFGVDVPDFDYPLVMNSKVTS